MTAPELRRSIGIVPATAMVVGTIIGASIFVQPSVMSAQLASEGAVLGAWIAAGALTLIGVLVTAELASAFPRTGGVYVFLTESFGPLAGFLWGWAMLWVMHTGIVAAIAVGCARYVGHLVPLTDDGGRAVAIAAIVALSAVNYLGVRAGSGLMTALTILKVAAVVGLVALLFAAPGAAPADAAASASPPLGGLLLAVGAGLFAFGGWHMVTYAAGETVTAQRTIPRALVLGTLLVTACYLALNAAYFHVLPQQLIAASRSVAADAVAAAAGPGAGGVVAGIVVVSTLGALNGVVLAGPRVYLAMAQERRLPAPLGAVHQRFRTPHVAIAVQALWASLLVLTGSYEALFGRVIYTEWLFFAAMAIGLLRLRAVPGYAPGWRLPFALPLTLLFAAAALAVAVTHIATRPLDSAAGLAIVLTGFPAYFLWARHTRRSERR